MRFEFYTDALENVPKLSVDGTVDNSIHFSHWEGNATPAELKADTSTEIALNLVASPHRTALTKDIELVTNNHFDTDGVLSVWTALTGERALAHRDLLIAAAEAGDFSEHSSDDGVRVSIAIQGSDQASPNSDDGSPLAGFIAGKEVDDDARAYELVLPEVEHLLTNINDYEHLWREGWNSVAAAIESFERGKSSVTEHSGISVVTLAPELFDGAGFSPTKHSAPYTAISKFARGELYVIAIPTSGGWFYRFDYPYYSWAETVVRPRIRRRDLSSALQLLNSKEMNRAGRWQTDNREMTSAVKFLDSTGTLAASRLNPDEVVSVLQTSDSLAVSSAS
jgi:post-segregation antitoxin (ccd killing protein)